MGEDRQPGDMPDSLPYLLATTAMSWFHDCQGYSPFILISGIWTCLICFNLLQLQSVLMFKLSNLLFVET